eukprot:GEMP01016821.1.p1 GENE.GEMP01016821.1~~GEMP01016821.1.p1  ORF type:complete len:779 (+),score=168.52 GEMP01016821.1:153-2489(+)
MEIDFWQFLVKDGGLCLKQHIPDIALFEGGRLVSWFYSTPKGLLTRRSESDKTIDHFHDKLLCLAEERLKPFKEQVTASTPVAILRKSSISAGSVSTPVAVVLTAIELNEFFDKVGKKRFEPDNEVFTVQSLIVPKADSRVVCAYSCDARGVEKTDIFGRTFDKLYPLDASRIIIPTPDCVEKDQCRQITGILRDRIESKVLALVRFVSSFYKKSVDAMIVEFIEDAQMHVVLHAFWAITTFSSYRPILVSAAPGAPVKGDHKIDTQTPMAHWGIPRHQEMANDGIPKILLEVWALEQFLGEAWLPSLPHIDGRQQSLVLTRVPGSRHDDNKTDASNSRGLVDISVRWSTSVPFGGPLRLILYRARNLKQTEEAGCPRVLLWVYDTEFSPLWTSREGTHPTNPQFQDTVELTIPCEHYRSPPDSSCDLPSEEFLGISTPSRPSRTSDHTERGKARNASPRPKPKQRPTSALGRLESQKRSSGSLRVAAVERVPGRHRTISHWGANQNAEAVSTHVFCSQIISRFNTERQNRSQMLSVMARQLERYRDVQCAWEEQRKGVLAFSQQLEQRMAKSQLEQENVLAEKNQENSALKHRLGAMYQGMTRELEKSETAHQQVECHLRECEQREREQISMIHHLETRNASLRDALDKTLEQLNESRGLESSQAVSRLPASTAPDERSGASPRVPSNSKDMDSKQDLLQKLCEARAEIAYLEEALSKERVHSSKLEEFVHGVAFTSPTSRDRTGGGFALDDASREQARSLLREKTFLKQNGCSALR